MSRNICEMSADANNYDSQNVDCQSLIPSSKILSRSPRFAKRAITNIANFPTSFSFYSCVTMDGNPAFTVHATAHAFRAAINLNSMLLRQQIWCLGSYLIFEGFTNFMLKWI